jgi:subtilisin family serine protease/WD40 repeat protein
MMKAFLFLGRSWFKKAQLSCGSMLLVAGLFLVCVGMDVDRCLGQPAPPPFEDLTSIDLGSSPSDGNSYMKLHATSVSSRPGTSFVRGVLVIQLAQDIESAFDDNGRLRTSDLEVDELLRAHGLLRAERLFRWDCEKNAGGTCSFLRLIFPEEVDLESLMNELKQARGIARVEPVGVHPVNYYPDDFYFGIQWGLNQVRDHDVNAPEAWDVERGDSSIVVAIVDTGVDWSHPDLGGAPPFTGGNIRTNWTEFYGTTGADDDGNGFVDDIRGWDFVTGVSGYAGEDVETPDNDPSDFFGHGTHVAGIAAALTGNSIGVAGLANRCKIMPVRAGWCAYDGTGKPAGVVRMDFCAEAVLYAARNGARIINCSWANDNSGGLDVAVDTAIARGAIVVVSAGNDHTSSTAYNYLGSRGDCFAVAATNSRDMKPYYSNFGRWISFCAPGDTIASTYYKLSTGEHAYAYYSGTSMAAPFVSALSALLLSKNPLLTRTDVLNIISSTCDPIDALNPGFSGQLGAGRIDAYAALSLGSGNWQARTQGEVVGSPLPMKSGLGKYIVVTSVDGCLYVYESGGEVAGGWPKCGLGSPTSPGAGDIDGDGGQELVVGSSSGNVYAWNVSGSVVAGWPQNLGAAVVSGPMVCDLNGEGVLELVCGCADSTVHVLSGNGSSEPGWPVKLTGSVTSEPCFAFMGEDTTAVILVATSDSRLHALKADGGYLGGWPVTVGSGLLRSCAAVDVEGDGRSEVFVGGSDGKVYAIDDDGTLLGGWPQTASGSLSRSLALGDVDGDRLPEVVGGTSSGRVYAWKLDGQPLLGWPVLTAGPVASSPSLVDLDSDGKCEVAVGSDDRDLHIWSSSGAPFAGWPRSTGGAVKSSPCIWDFDEDGVLELAVGSDDTKLHFWEVAGSQAADSLMPWPMYRHDALRSGNSGSRVSSPLPEERPGLAVSAFPNPFVGTVTFECVVKGDRVGSGERGRILLYDVTGRQVALLHARGEGRTLTLLWDGGNQYSRKLASGVYLYRADVDGLKASGKLVFFKQ